MKRSVLLCAFLFSACLPGTEPASESPADPDSGRTVYGRELGTLTAIYPVPMPDGNFAIELRLTRDTVFVDLESLQAFAADSAGKALIRSASEPFYTRDEKCFYNPKKEDCLEFRKASGRPRPSALEKRGLPVAETGTLPSFSCFLLPPEDSPDGNHANPRLSGPFPRGEKIIHRSPLE
jgi:hypothetical protein